MSGRKNLKGEVQDMKERVLLFRAAGTFDKLTMIDDLIRDAAELLGALADSVDRLESVAELVFRLEGQVKAQGEALVNSRGLSNGK